jgi:putative membrane-bound dehydrogenase-like protein
MKRAIVPLLLVAGLVAAADFPAPYDSEKQPGKPLPADEAARGFKVPDGFTVDVFAAEPQVRNPIALTWDTRGRLWVGENFTYAERDKKYDLTLKDRVLIFHDKDGDGKPDETKTFLDTAERLTGLEVGLGGAWLMCPPRVLFVPDRNRDDVPDGPPEVVLEGFTVPTENYHNLANGLRWGPDGWLYGRCGASAPGMVRRPDQPPEAAIPVAGGIWRYHPKTKQFEPLCHGTTNPWGHDWDANGECFFTNTVNGHLWHLIPGSHLRRPHTISPNPYVYEPMDMAADHWHFDTGKTWNAARDTPGSSDALGGGHAHCGALIYQGTQWPQEYRGKLLTLNFHGRRVNVERLERSGSSYVGKHEPDMLQSNDPFFRGIDLTTGPDGSVYVLDWSDTGECHEHTGVHRSSGRIYRVSYGRPKPTPPPDLTRKTDPILIADGEAPNGWLARMTARELCDREAAGRDVSFAVRLLTDPGPDTLAVPKARRPALGRLLQIYALGLRTVEQMTGLYDSHNEHTRAWAIRLRADHWPLDTATGTPRANDTSVPSQTLDRFVRMAREDQSGLVRLALASTLQRLPVKHRPALAAALLSRVEDAADPHLSHLIWYGLIPVAEADPGALARLAADAKLPRVREWAARRLAEMYAAKPAPLNVLLAETVDAPEAARRDVVAGMTAGFAGVRKAAPPPTWKAYPKPTDPDTAAKVQALDVVFGDGRALDEVRRLALDGKADLNVRKAALLTLIEAGPPDLRAVCESLLKTRFLNATALKGLTRFADPAVGKLIAANYRTFHPSERAAVVEALAARPEFASELLDLLGKGVVARGELSAFQARQVRSFNDPALTKKLAEVWGEFRDSPKDKADLIAKLKAELTPDKLAKADKRQGRAVFAQTCATCHRLFGEGAEVGPDLTGAGRKDLDYLLSNVIDPSAVVTKDFQMTVFALADGRVVNGVAVAETPAAVTVQTDKERVVLAKGDIEARKASPLSLMPDGLLQPLPADRVRDLIAYLMSDSQVPLSLGK